MADNNPLTHFEEVLTSQKLVAAGPLDNKIVIDTTANRNLIPAIQRYHGMLVFVQEEAKTYILDDAGDLTNTGWRSAFSSASGYLGIFEPDVGTVIPNILRDNNDDVFAAGDFANITGAGFWNFTTGDQSPNGGGDHVENLVAGQTIRYGPTGIWEVEASSDLVTSVNTKLGDVLLRAEDIPNDAITGMSALDTQAALVELKNITDGISGGAVYKGAFDPANPPANPPTDLDTVNFSQGDFFAVSVAGDWNFTNGDQSADGGGDNWHSLAVGDQIRFNASDIWDVIPVAATPPAGSVQEIQFNDGGTFGAVSRLYYNKTKDMLVAGASSGLEPTFGVNANAGAWSAIFGEEHTIGPNNGRPANILVSGWKNVIGDLSVGGAFAASSSVTLGNYHINDSLYSFVAGFGMQTGAGQGAIAMGLGYDAGTDGVIDVRLQSKGRVSFNISEINASATPGEGALADNGGILGGLNHHIPADSPRSIILGGNAIAAAASVPDTIYMPKVRIGQGTGGELPTTGETHSLAINSTTGEIIQIDLAGGGTPAGNDTEIQFNNAGAFGSNAEFKFAFGQLQIGTIGVNPYTFVQGGLIGLRNNDNLVATLGKDSSGDWGELELRNATNTIKVLINGTEDEAAAFFTSGAIRLPKGTTGERPGTPQQAQIRFNETDAAFEGYDGTEWGALGGGSSFAVQSITHSSEGALDIDFSAGSFAIVTLEANVTSLTFSGGDIEGQILFIQDATGGRTVAFTGINTIDGAIPDYSTAANASSLMTVTEASSKVYMFGAGNMIAVA